MPCVLNPRCCTGYGNSGPNNCAAASAILVVQSLVGIILDALTLGVLFARISHPAQRSHSIFLSESAVVLRRDGILKFCFRCADVKATQVTWHAPMITPDTHMLFVPGAQITEVATRGV